MCSCFEIKRVIPCNPMALPLRAKEYISHDPRDTVFGALPYTRTAWPDASLALPDYKAKQVTTALEKALYNAQAHCHAEPSSHILILPNWQHSPYLARNLHSSYTPKLSSIPYLQPPNNTHNSTHNTKNNIYLVANEKAFRLLDKNYGKHTLHDTLSRILGRDIQPIALNLSLNDPTHLASRQAYKDTYPSSPSMPHTNDPPHTHTH